MFSTPHSPLSEEVFVEKELSFFCVFLPVEMQQKVRKAAWFMGCGTLHQRASGFPNCVQHLILGVFWSIAHTPPFLSVPSARTPKLAGSFCFKEFCYFFRSATGGCLRKNFFL